MGLTLPAAANGQTVCAAYLVADRGLTPAAAIERVRKTSMIRPSSFERLIDQRLTLEPAK